MPLFWFDEDDAGTHDLGEGPVETLMEYLDDIGADDIADRISMAQSDSVSRNATIDGLEALQHVTDDGLEWSIRGGKLMLQ